MKLKRIFASLLSLGLLLSPISLQADEIVAVASDNSAYTSYKGAWAAAQSGLKVTMMEDWNLEDRLVVEENQNVTIEMNGFKINRNLYDDESYGGEVIYLSENSTLTLTGNNYKDTQINFKGYNESTDPSDLTITSGGLVTGGYSKNGAGGIHMKSGSKLYLENVAVAGNSSTLHNTNGGGININNDDCQLHMTNAQICYNHSGYGAGIYVAGENEQIVMDASSISNNYATKDGGGIYSNKDATYITMTNGSSIKNNYASTDGGGIYFDNPYCQVRSPDKSAEISNNTALTNGGGVCYGQSSRGDTQIIENVTFDSNIAQYKGGAIYALQEDLTFKDCTFTKNGTTQGYGGAIYVDAKNVLIDGCTIQENVASEAGGGVCVQNLKDVYISGKTIIENNIRTDGSNDDVFLSKMWWTQSYVSGTPESGSRIGIRCDNERQVGIDQTEDNGSFFADEDGFKITYKDGKLYKESGSILGSIFGNANLGAAIVVIVGIAAVGAVAFVFDKKKKHGEA